MKYPGQYVLGYVQAFIEAHDGLADLPQMDALLAEARHLVAPKP